MNFFYSFRKLFNFFIWNIRRKKLGVPSSVVYIIEGADWVIKRIGKHIEDCASSAGLNFTLDASSKFYANKLIHFGSLHTFSGGFDNVLNGSNKIIVTIFHGDRGISSEMDASINKLIKSIDKLERIIVSNSTMKRRLISWGVAEKKIKLIPIGVDLRFFKAFSEDKRLELRKHLGVPKDAICIGSFQKDGIGWGKGLEPKLIKGPDVFVDSILRLSKKKKVHCLLTGPARGYVINKLSEGGIPYTYRFLDNYQEVAEFYNCLDLYLVTSREEGGPEAIMESMACGVPLVSTRVGMAPDIIKHRYNAMMVDVENVNGIVACADELLNDKELRGGIVKNGLDAVRDYSWNNIAQEYLCLYRDVLGVNYVV